jgi:hypothetical protein
MDIDRPPKEWVSERRKPSEPIFGPGWPHAVRYLAYMLLMVAMSYGLRSWMTPEQRPAPLPPGAYIWTPEHGVVPAHRD